MRQKLSRYWQGTLRFLDLSGAERTDVLRALRELWRARRQLHSMPAVAIARMDDPAMPMPTETQACAAARVSKAIGRAAPIVPWRSDCLVQALAARALLERQGVPTRLCLGARQSAEVSRPDTHAWLLCGEVVVTGGDIATFRHFVAASLR